MKKVKENEIYPKFEFRLSHEDKAWLTKELRTLKIKFNDGEHSVVTKNTLLIAALKHGIRHLRSRKKLV